MDTTDIGADGYRRPWVDRWMVTQRADKHLRPELHVNMRFRTCRFYGENLSSHTRRV